MVSESEKKYSLPLKLFLFIGLSWSGLIILLLIWTIRSSHHHIDMRTLTQARAFFKQVVLTRYWNSIHGGVYVPVTEKTQPNPYLDVPRRDVTTRDGQVLTLINPAYMTRQIAEIADGKGTIRFHITSLKPIRPGNEPDEWEAVALKQFLAEPDEYHEWQLQDGKEKAFRYMAPLITEKPCLSCHSKQGYVEGDVRGGISVTIPANDMLSEKKHIDRLLVFDCFLIWIIGMSGIFLSFRVSGSEYRARTLLIEELKAALKDVKILKGFIPICASCKKIRNDDGYWDQIEVYIRDHSDAEFSHGICPDCIEKLYPGLVKKGTKNENRLDQNHDGETGV